MNKLVVGNNQPTSSQMKVMSNKMEIDKCFEDQNGLCMFPNCKQSIYIVLNAKSAFTYQQKFLGICEKHFEENVKKDNKKSSILGIKRY